MEMSMVPRSHGMPALRGERQMFATSDDKAVMRQIEATHAHDGREFNVKPLLYIVEDIFQRANPGIPGTDQEKQAQIGDVLDDKAFQSGFFDMLDLLSSTINKISCELASKCTGGSDPHAITLGIFNMIASYSWDAKVVLALTAFAMNYGEFWVVAQLYSINPLAKSVAQLKQLPELIERVETLRPKFEALTNLMRAMLDVTKCIVDFKEFPSQYITPDEPEMVAATAHIPTAVYWTIRSIVACSTQILGLIGMGHEFISSTTETWELSSLAHKVNSIYNHLNNQKSKIHNIIDEKMYQEAYRALIRLMETPHIDNMKVLRALIYASDDQLPLFDGPSKRRVHLDVLRRKNVLLFISELDIPDDELFILDQLHQDSRAPSTRMDNPYEVVWIPIVDRSTQWDTVKQEKFEARKERMPWFSVNHPSMIDRAVVQYIKDYWHFNKKPILVVLDPHGRVANKNALHMMWIWGTLAFPFTDAKEESLWRDESWRIELLADTVDPAIPNWIAENRYICLYGGEDMDWIFKFTEKATRVAQIAEIPLVMLYVGKSNPREKVRRNIDLINQQKLSYTLPDATYVWFFWVRLESMWHSKIKHGKTVENDHIMQEIVTMLSFDGSDQGWAVIGWGNNNVMAKAKAEKFIRIMDDYETWKVDVPPKGFIPAMNDYAESSLHTPHHCNRLILPSSTGTIPEKVVCAECSRPMEKFIMYRCCTD